MRRTRRDFLRTASGAAAAMGLPLSASTGLTANPASRPPQASSVKVIHPMGRRPISWIVDDSTCLVNLNRFTMPHFALLGRSGTINKRWRDMPYEIPDAFVRRFGHWCARHGVKGKWSVVPYPAYVGRLDRELPGWTARELADSLRLVRDVMMPNWDIHPEMITHTRVIDLKTGQPYPEHTALYAENYEWTNGKSADELTAYLSYALNILKNAGLHCDGVTSPGQFGMNVESEYGLATLEACRNVFGTEIPNYFLHVVSSGPENVSPRVLHASGLEGNDPRCVVSIIGCTEDWTGNWNCVTQPSPDLFITPDLSSGRLVEVIERGEAAVPICHWTGIYYNGHEFGFQAFREVIRRIETRYDDLLWMKLSELARYWAARELTRIDEKAGRLSLRAPFACPAFTIQVKTQQKGPVTLGTGKPLLEVAKRRDLKAGAWMRDGETVTVCFDLPKGKTTLAIGNG